MSTTPQAPTAPSGRPKLPGVEIVIGLALAAFATLILLCISIDGLEGLRGQKALEGWGQFFIVWLMVVPIPRVLYGGSRYLWRAVTHARPAWRQVFRGTILAFFRAPSVVGAGGPTGAFMLPGPAFLMLIFGQWHFKLWLGLLPILIAWPVAIVAYSLWEGKHKARD